MYKSVGKMFIKQSKTQILNHLSDKTVKDEEEVKNLKIKQQYLEDKVKETESNIQDILKTVRGQ